MNTSNTSYLFEMRYCDIMTEMNLKVSSEKLSISVVFDLVAGLVASGFVRKFYQGIEVSHPIYAIVFSNIVFTTFLSYFSFFCTTLEIVLDSCIPSFLVLWLTICSLFMNAISMMVIAFLRYYLLITSKDKNGDCAMNMEKIRTVSLTVNWGVITVVSIVRGLLLFPSFVDGTNRIIRMVFNFGLLFIIIITLVVYYKMDLKLRTKKEAMDKQEYGNMNVLGSERITSVKQSIEIKDVIIPEL